MIIATTIAFAVFLVTLWRRDFGMGALILLWPAYLLRTSLWGVPTTALELSVYGASLAALIVNTYRRQWSRTTLPRWWLTAMLLWVIAWVVATAWSADRQASLGALKAWLVDPLLFGWLILETTHREQSRRLILKAAMVSGLVVAIAGLTQLWFFRGTLQDNRLSSFFAPVANYAAMYLGPLLVLTVAAVFWKLVDRRWLMAAGVMAVALALTVSFGGYLSVILALALLWWRWPDRRVKRLTLAAGVAVIGFGILVLSFTPYLSEKLNTRDRSSSVVRTQIWRTAVEMIKDRPWLGVGPNAFELVYRQTIPKLYWPPLEWLVAQPHQLILALWLETGLLGLIAFTFFLWRWWQWLRPRFSVSEGPAVVAAAAMTAILVHGLVDTPYFKNDLAMVFVFVALLPLIFTGEKQTNLRSAG